MNQAMNVWCHVVAWMMDRSDNFFWVRTWELIGVWTTPEDW